jgi:predicted PurR-regulated permease PerM
MQSGLRQFCYGTGVGMGLTVLALFGQDRISSSSIDSVGNWLQLNLGHSIWLFAAVALLFIFTGVKLAQQLRRNFKEPDETSTISALDQMLDVWTQVFIGIGVVWTAVGMRAALQYALGEPDMALADSADNVLRKLVDGGILLALTTTIVGAVGGYLMRLCKTITLGSALQHYYDQLERRDIAELVAATQRIEQQLQPDPPANQNITCMPGAQL